MLYFYSLLYFQRKMLLNINNSIMKVKSSFLDMNNPNEWYPFYTTIGIILGKKLLAVAGSSTS